MAAAVPILIAVGMQHVKVNQAPMPRVTEQLVNVSRMPQPPCVWLACAGSIRMVAVAILIAVGMGHVKVKQVLMPSVSELPASAHPRLKGLCVRQVFAELIPMVVAAPGTAVGMGHVKVNQARTVHVLVLLVNVCRITVHHWGDLIVAMSYLMATIAAVR